MVLVELRSWLVACVESIDERSEELTFAHRLPARAMPYVLSGRDCSTAVGVPMWLATRHGARLARKCAKPDGSYAVPAVIDDLCFKYLSLIVLL